MTPRGQNSITCSRPRPGGTARTHHDLWFARLGLLKRSRRVVAIAPNHAGSVVPAGRRERHRHLSHRSAISSVIMAVTPSDPTLRTTVTGTLPSRVTVPAAESNSIPATVKPPMSAKSPIETQGPPPRSVRAAASVPRHEQTDPRTEGAAHHPTRDAQPSESSPAASARPPPGAQSKSREAPMPGRSVGSPSQHGASSWPREPAGQFPVPPLRRPGHPTNPPVHLKMRPDRTPIMTLSSCPGETEVHGHTARNLIA